MYFHKMPWNRSIKRKTHRHIGHCQNSSWEGCLPFSLFSFSELAPKLHPSHRWYGSLLSITFLYFGSNSMFLGLPGPSRPPWYHGGLGLGSSWLEQCRPGPNWLKPNWQNPNWLGTNWPGPNRPEPKWPKPSRSGPNRPSWTGGQLGPWSAWPLGSHPHHAQDACEYVDEEVCNTVKQEVCEDGPEWWEQTSKEVLQGKRLISMTTFEQGHKESWHISKRLHILRECSQQTRYEEEGADVVECDPTSKTVCVAKTKYEPEEYDDDECTTTTEEVCKTNYVRTSISTILHS